MAEKKTNMGKRCVCRDIFPPALSAEPALSGTEWFSGKTAAPKLISLEDGATAVVGLPTSTSSAMRVVPTKTATAPPSLPSPVQPAPAPAPKEEFKERVASPETTEDLPKVTELEIEEKDEESEEDEKHQVAFRTAASTPPAQVPVVAKASSTEDSSAVRLVSFLGRLKCFFRLIFIFLVGRIRFRGRTTG